MEPVQPTPSPDAQGTTALPDAQQPASGGRFSRVTGLASRALGLDQQPTAVTQAPTTSFGPPATPGLQPRPDTTPATGAVVPSPWASPDTTAVAQAAPAMPDAALASEPVSGIAIAGQTPGLTREPQGPTLAHDWLSNPAAPLDTTATVATEPSTVEPTPAPEPAVEAAVDATVVHPEPTAAPAPEPTPTVSPVWTPDASPAQPNTAIEPNSPSVEPTPTPTAEPIPDIAEPVQTARDATSAVEDTGEITKKWNLTPEQKQKLADIARDSFLKSLENITDGIPEPKNTAASQATLADLGISALNSSTDKPSSY